MNKSKAFYNGVKFNNVSHLVSALEKLDEEIKTDIEGQFYHTVIIECNHTIIRNSELDCEFDIEFDDDTAPNEAEIVIYNLSDKTNNCFSNDKIITVTAGYGDDTGVIFKGFVTSRKTYYEEADKVTVIKAIDDRSRQGREVESVTFTGKTKASYILKHLCGKTGLPIAVFKTVRDYTYTDEVTVDGDLADAIKQYATVCGVSAYICKGKLYVRPLKDGDDTKFLLSADTGLLSVSEFEKENRSDEYTDIIRGCEVECLLQHRIQTASLIQLNSKVHKGIYRVRNGRHRYDGTDFITEFEAIQA